MLDEARRGGLMLARGARLAPAIQPDGDPDTATSTTPNLSNPQKPAKKSLRDSVAAAPSARVDEGLSATETGDSMLMLTASAGS